jgi:hypothetical protein
LDKSTQKQTGKWRKGKWRRRRSGGGRKEVGNWRIYLDKDIRSKERTRKGGVGEKRGKGYGQNLQVTYGGKQYGGEKKPKNTKSIIRRRI